MSKKTQTITRKIKLQPVGDKEEINRVYKFLRDGMYAQNRAYNILISTVFSAIVSGKSADEIKEIYKRGQRKPKELDPEYSLYKYDDFVFPTGTMTPPSVARRVRADIDKAKNDGLFKGNVSLPNKKREAPLIVEKQEFSLYHPYESDEEFYDKLFSSSLEVYMKYVNGIVFKFVLGRVDKSEELRSVIGNIFDGVYQVQGSSIQIIDKKDKNEIILNLSIAIPIQEIKLNEDTVVGVDLGLAVPAVCSLNNKKYVKQFIGSADDFLRVRTQLRSQRRRLQRSLKYAVGGHGRKKKLKSMNRFRLKEQHYAETYNHMVSRRVVQFALKHKAKYINMEDLKGFDSSNYILSNWSFYQLQQYITYKAKMYGIEVRKVNPYHTSQICSCCGHWEEGQRISQSEFVCKNPECKNYNKTVNADFNASRNIAMSTDFVTKKKNK